MTLAPGSRLGPYEIAGQIGAGGMGEVYRAKDPRLGRDVAIKVLPATFSQDPDRLRRFEQEARAAGVLNHPNVTAVYDIGSHDSSPYVVQELLEGETLRAELATGRFAPRKAIDYGIQIAQGLAAAHDKGIVHRDLKPENVFVTKDGRVKILDFGLAKLTETRPPSEITSLPTETRGTEPGVVLGTLGYMSPEQVRGRPADARSDLFALGSILYEMLSGQRAFRGDSAADTMSAILREDPPDLSLTNRGVSPALERIIRHCLDKNPERRFQSARDLAFDLESLSGLSTPVETSVRPRGRFGPLPLPVALLLAVIAGILAGSFLWKTRPPMHPSYRRLTYRPGTIFTARFTPDGHTAVYAASWDQAGRSELYSVRPESPESLRMTLPEGQVAAISRAGEMLLLHVLRYGVGWTATGTLSQTSLSGTAPRDLLEDVAEADWSPDGNSLAVVRAPGWHYRLEYPAGKVLYDTDGWIGHARVSPDAKFVAFLDHPVFGDDLGSVAVVDRSGKKTTLSTRWGSTQGLAWSPSGKEIWFTGSEAGGAYSLRGVTLAGKLRTVATAPGYLTLQDVSREGRALFIQRNVRSGFLALLSEETKERDLSGFDYATYPRLSEDRKMFVYTEEAEGGGPGYTVYMRRLDGSPAVRLGEGEAMAVSPDGRWVLTRAIREASAPLVILPTGAGEPRRFPRESIDHSRSQFGAFLPDGKSVVFNGSEPGRPPRAFVQGLAGGAPRAITPEGIVAQLLSPDGKTLLVRTPDGLAASPIEGGPSRPVPGLQTDDRPLRWASDGRAVFVTTRSRQLPSRVIRVDLETGERKVWKEFQPADSAGLTFLGAAAVSGDGQTILFTYNRILCELDMADGLE
jgi:serine/threonine protein kinase